MKKLAAMLLSILILAGCGSQTAPQEPETQEPQTAVTEEQPQTPADPSEEETPPTQEEEPLYEVKLVEGLVEDAIGYTLEKPVFDQFTGSPLMNTYYTALTDHLERFIKETVYDHCLRENCMASVFGTVEEATLVEDVFTLTYRYEVEYSNQENHEVSERTDHFNIFTGEILKEAE